MFDSVTAKCYSFISSGIVSFLTKWIHCHHLEYKEKATKRILSVKKQSILWQKHSAFQNMCPKNANFSPFLLSESRSGMVGFFHNTGTCSSRTVEMQSYVLCNQWRPSWYSVSFPSLTLLWSLEIHRHGLLFILGAQYFQSLCVLWSYQGLMTRVNRKDCKDLPNFQWFWWLKVNWHNQ